MRLFDRIFLPVLVALLVLPLATYAIFLAASNVYVRREAEQAIAQTLDEVTGLAEIYLGDLEENKTIDKEAQQDFLRSIRRLSRGLTGDTHIISLNSELKITYPIALSERPETAEVAGRFAAALGKEGDWLRPTQSLLEISIDESRYIIHATEMMPQTHGRTKYLIVYSALYDLAGVLHSAGRVVLLVCCALALCALLLLFLAYRAVARPLSRLTEYARDTGGGNIESIDVRSGIREIDALISEINAMAKRINRYDADQKAFFQNASHELRTPLMSIQGYAECIAGGVFEDDKEAAGIIVSESERLSRRISTIISLSRLDDPAAKRQRTPVRLSDALTKCTRRVEGQALERKLEIAVENGAADEVVPDAELFDLALENVLSNAVRHADKRVEICVQAQDAFVRVTVKDDGPGFAPEDLPHIFERFYKGKSGGSGLGLSIAKTAATNMGGSIQARNENGAAVTLSLPRARETSP